MGSYIDDGLRRKLERGQVHTEGSKHPQGHRGAVGKALIGAPMDKVMEAIADFEHYDEFMPHTTVAEVERREGDELWFRTALDFKVKTVGYTLHVKLDPEGRGLSWTLAAGDLSFNDGRWELEPYGPDQQQTFATYTAYVNPGFYVPGFMLGKLTEGSLPAVMKAVRKRVGDTRY